MVFWLDDRPYVIGISLAGSCAPRARPRLLSAAGPLFSANIRAHQGISG
jgi:hypothetical protein